MYRFPDTRVLLFAKEPVYGQVKTRLHEAIGAEKALDLYCAMLDYQVKWLDACQLAPWEMWLSGNPDNPMLAQAQKTVAVHPQQGDDLGERMLTAAEAALSRASAVIPIGTDCPSLDMSYLCDAIRQLQEGRQVVIGPAEDGGYVLLGLRGSWSGLFKDIPWGTDQVLQLSLERLERLGLDYSVLPARWDVDRPEDLARLADLEPPLDFQLDGF